MLMENNYLSVFSNGLSIDYRQTHLANVVVDATSWIREFGIDKTRTILPLSTMVIAVDEHHRSWSWKCQTVDPANGKSEVINQLLAHAKEFCSNIEYPFTSKTILVIANVRVTHIL